MADVENDDVWRIEETLFMAISTIARLFSSFFIFIYRVEFVLFVILIYLALVKRRVEFLRKT